MDNPATAPAGRSRLVVMIATALITTLCLVPSALSGKEKFDKKALSQVKLSKTFYDNGRLAEALQAADRAIDLEPKYPLAHQIRGQVLFSMDALDEALKAFDRVLDLDRDYTDARNWKAFALVQLKRYDEAMREYDRALQDLSYPTPEKIHLNKGMLYRLMGRPEEAIPSLQKSVDLNASYARGYYELGRTYEEMGQDGPALRAYQDALVGMDESADLNLRLGLALVRSGQDHRARQHFEKVIRLAPDGPEAVQARDEIKKLQAPS